MTTKTFDTFTCNRSGCGQKIEIARTGQPVSTLGYLCTAHRIEVMGAEKEHEERLAYDAESANAEWEEGVRFASRTLGKLEGKVDQAEALRSALSRLLHQAADLQRDAKADLNELLSLAAEPFVDEKTKRLARIAAKRVESTVGRLGDFWRKG